MAVGIHAQESLSIGHLPAAVDLSGSQFKFVTVGPSGVNVVSGTTQIPLGVLGNKPKVGQPCHILTIGVSEVIAGVAGIAAGDPIYVTAAGTVSKVATSTRIGIALEAATSGKLFTALVLCGSAVAGTV